MHIIDVDYRDRRSSLVSVCLSVGHVRKPCKTAEPIEMPLGG